MKKVISFVLALSIVFSLIAGMSISSNAYTAHSQSEAVSWANSKVGVKTGSGQCVALITAYYSYLGVSPSSGNGCDYTKNTLPSGWTRIPYSTGFVAKPGDIAVWTWNKWAGNYGHVAIVTSADSSKMYYVDQGKTYGYKGHSGDISYTNNNWSFYGVIRPDFGPYFANTDLLINSYNKIQVKFNFKNPTKTKITKFVSQIRKKGETSWNGYKRTLSYTSGFWKKTTFAPGGPCKYSVSDGTTYEIRGYAVSASKTYYSDIVTVTTPARVNINNAQISGSSSVKYTASNISVNSLINVYYGGRKLTKGTDFKLSKDNVKNIGKHSITVTGIGAFKGSRTIKITVYPKTPTLNSLSYSSFTGRVSLKWARVADCSKQQIAMSKSSSFESSKSVIFNVGSEKQSCSIYSYTMNGKNGHIEKGKTYYFKMRAYKVVNGERIYGKWGSVKSIKCK